MITKAIITWFTWLKVVVCPNYALGIGFFSNIAILVQIMQRHARDLKNVLIFIHIRPSSTHMRTLVDYFVYRLNDGAHDWKVMHAGVLAI
jgi:hypothetical protein